MTQEQKDYIEQKCKELKQELETKFASENKPKFWRPEDGKIAWTVSTHGNIQSFNEWGTDEINYNNVYPTKELAEKARDLHLCEMRLKEAIWDLNEGREYPFIHDKHNYAVDFRCNNLQPEAWTKSKLYPNWYYLESRETCNELIESHKDDLLMWLTR